MQRIAMKKLKEWKTKRNRKPLILKGARQVGKTWLMKQFGADCFKKCSLHQFLTAMSVCVRYLKTIMTFPGFYG